jgi:hypothetical protein
MSTCVSMFFVSCFCYCFVGTLKHLIYSYTAWSLVGARICIRGEDTIALECTAGTYIYIYVYIYIIYCTGERCRTSS